MPEVSGPAKVKVEFEGATMLVPRDEFRRILTAAKSQLNKLWEMEGSQFPPVDRRASMHIDDMQFYFKMY